MSKSRHRLTDIVEIARGAGKLIMSFRQGVTSLDVQHKPDKSPVTEADHAANSFIEEKLMALPDALPVLSEESVIPDYAIRQQWQSYWLVDPLDGTRGFVDGGPDFTVNIALVAEGIPVLGVVHVPTSDTCYVAEQGSGAFIIESSGALWKPISCRQQTHRITLSTSARRASSRYQQLKARLQSQGYEVSEKREGSSLKLCRIAEGTSDIYPCFLPTSEWDTAAGQVIVEQAGGLVIDLDTGVPLRYNGKSSLLNPTFLVVADPAFYWKSLVGGADSAC